MRESRIGRTDKEYRSKGVEKKGTKTGNKERWSGGRRKKQPDKEGRK
jgi:hypothetical protein